jgi:hypothetical protein
LIIRDGPTAAAAVLPVVSTMVLGCFVVCQKDAFALATPCTNKIEEEAFGRERRRVGQSPRASAGKTTLPCIELSIQTFIHSS